MNNWLYSMGEYMVGRVRNIPAPAKRFLLADISVLHIQSGQSYYVKCSADLGYVHNNAVDLVFLDGHATSLTDNEVGTVTSYTYSESFFPW